MSKIQTFKLQNLVINALSNWTALGINIIIAFFLTPYIIKNVDKTGYGIWTLVSTITGYYGLLNLGVSAAINRYVARYTTQKNTKSLNEIANTALFMFCITGLVIILSSLFFSNYIASFFNIASQDLKHFTQVYYYYGYCYWHYFPGRSVWSYSYSERTFCAVQHINNIK
jgi:O-antigen/teichoic acid export membrane protein